MEFGLSTAQFSHALKQKAKEAYERKYIKSIIPNKYFSFKVYPRLSEFSCLTNARFFPAAKKSYIKNKSIKEDFYCITSTQSSGSVTKEFDIDVNTASSNHKSSYKH